MENVRSLNKILKTKWRLEIGISYDGKPEVKHPVWGRFRGVRFNGGAGVGEGGAHNHLPRSVPINNGLFRGRHHKKVEVKVYDLLTECDKGIWNFVK